METWSTLMMDDSIRMQNVFQQIGFFKAWAKEDLNKERGAAIVICDSPLGHYSIPLAPGYPLTGCSQFRHDKISPDNW